ncbi:hypothetical protein [Paenimyroides ceti]
MDALELIQKSSREVRGNSNLMAIYIKAYKEQFGFTPNCAGCTFNSDFQKLKNALSKNNQKPLIQIEMENTFKLLKVSGAILTYKKDGKVFRKYDNKLTEEFAIGYLTNGTKEELELRKKEFKKLPKGLNKSKEETNSEEGSSEVEKEETKVSTRKTKQNNK